MNLEQVQVEKPITLNEARAILNNISRPTLGKWIKVGRIRSHRMGKGYFFFASEIIEDIKNTNL